MKMLTVKKVTGIKPQGRTKLEQKLKGTIHEDYAEKKVTGIKPQNRAKHEHQLRSTPALNLSLIHI
eukprot:8552493-Ditylum_brightwellii.AAC.1